MTAIGIWNLEFWNLELGVWCLVLGIWNLNLSFIPFSSLPSVHFSLFRTIRQKLQVLCRIVIFIYRLVIFKLLFGKLGFGH